MTKPEDWGGASSNTRTFEHCDTCCLSLLLSSPPFFQLLITSSPTFVHIPLLFLSPSYFSPQQISSALQRSKGSLIKKLVPGFNHHLLTVLMNNICILPPWSCSEMIKKAVLGLHQSLWTYISSLSNGGMFWHLLVPSKPQCFCVRGDLKDYSKNFNFTVFSPELEPTGRLANSKRQR